MGTIAQKVQWTWDCKRDIEQALLERGIALPQDFRDFGDAIRSIGRKPYDSEVEYLESTGTQYIDTGIVPTQTTRIKFAYMLTQTPTDGFAAAFGCLGATGGASSGENAYSGFALFNNPSVPVQARVGKSTAANIISDISVAANVRYEGDVQFGRMQLNGTEYTQSGSGSWITMTRTICTHAANDDSSTLSRRFVQARFFSFSIYDGSTLVRDFIPVRKNGVGYLYDKVSGKLFGNAGTGAFLYGGDVREVEYIESTGTQYIDTGITGGSTSKIELVAASQNNSEYQALVGARNGPLFSFSIWQYSATNQATGPRFDYVGSTIGSNPNVGGGTWNTSGLNTVVKDGRYNYLNGVQLTSNNEATFSCPCPFTLFALNNNGSPIYPAKCKMYSCKIYDSGVLVRDFIPYRIGNKGCLYDRVSGKFFTNAGTGDFAVGADVLNPTTTSKAVYDAKVEYIESTGTQYIDTGIIPDGKGTSVECVFSNSVDGNFTPVLWTRGTNATDRAYCFELEQRQQARWDYADYGPVQVANAFPLNEKVTLTIKDGTATVNGVQMTRASKEFTAAGPMILCNFCNYVNGERQMISANVNPVRIYSCKVFSDGLLVRDFIPVRKDGRGCLCDLVTGRLFENAGTGVFKFGEDVVDIPADTEMIYDAEVEYLETTGTQYIDTGIVGSSAVDTEIVLALPAQKIIGALARNPTIRYHVGRESNGRWGVYLAESTVFRGPSSDDFVSVEIHPSTGTCIVAGTTTTQSVATFDTGRNIYLFALNDANGIKYTSGKLASCKLYSNGVLVRDFQPVRKNGVGYLFDKVGRKLYGNAGTGAFTYGGDK